MAKKPAAEKLEQMTHDELISLRDEIDQRLKQLEKARRKEALAAAKEAAGKMGFALEELIGAAPSARSQKSASAKGVPKYAHPENPSITWTGKGRQPNWVKEHLSKGGKLEDLSI